MPGGHDLNHVPARFFYFLCYGELNFRTRIIASPPLIFGNLFFSKITLIIARGHGSIESTVSLVDFM
jgi:hypothetical protein